jgi:hypothetical protein
MWFPFISILNIYSNTRATLKEATFPFILLLCRMSYCFVVCPTALSRVLLLCRTSYYFIIVFTTPPWVPLLCRMSNYFIIVFTTPPWVLLLRCGLHYSAVCSTYLTAYKSAWFVLISCWRARHVLPFVITLAKLAFLLIHLILVIRRCL